MFLFSPDENERNSFIASNRVHPLIDYPNVVFVAVHCFVRFFREGTQEKRIGTQLRMCHARCVPLALSFSLSYPLPFLLFFFSLYPSPPLAIKYHLTNAMKNRAFASSEVCLHFQRIFCRLPCFFFFFFLRLISPPFSLMLY